MNSNAGNFYADFMYFSPVEKMTGVTFSIWCDILMTGNGLDGIAVAEGLQKPVERLVLGFGKRFEITAFHLDADGEGIAFFAPAERRHAGVVGHVVAGNELYGFAGAGDEKVAGNAQFVNHAEKGMVIGVDAVGKQFFHRAVSVFERGQGNIVQYGQ